MDGFRARKQKKASQQQEKRVAAAMGGRTQAASGATKFGGGDVRAPGYLIECKYTEKDSYTLKYDELMKVQRQARKRLEESVLVFGFRNRFGRISEQYAVRAFIPETLVYSATSYAHGKSARFRPGEILTAIQYPYILCFRLPPGSDRGEAYFQIHTWEDFCQTRGIRSDQGAA